MYIVSIDCGTTNTRAYVLNSTGDIINGVSKKIGVRNTAITGNNKELRFGIRDLFNKAIQGANLEDEDISCILSSGMITSELGLLEIPHLSSPCNISELSHTLTRFEDPEIFPSIIPTYFVRGIKNGLDVSTPSLNEIGLMDFMRGEETQIVGLLQNPHIILPVFVTILSSHTKIIAIDSNRNILGSLTSISGQFYETMKQMTSLSKSLRKRDNVESSNYFNEELVAFAYQEVLRYGLLRVLMYIRFFDTLAEIPWYARTLFAESVIASDDIRMFKKIIDLTNLNSKEILLVGNEKRCKIYDYLIRENLKDCFENIHIISEPSEIENLSVRGVFAIAKKAGVF